MKNVIDAATYCTETYQDALAWDLARIEREQAAIFAYLREHPLISQDNLMVLIRENRALRMARLEGGAR
jgi:hypothetical protein